MKSRIIIAITACLLAGCSGLPFARPTVTVTTTPMPPTATSTSTITATPTIVRTQAPSATPTPPWITQGPGHVLVPIFMYHHITGVPIGKACVFTPDDLCVSPDSFNTQLKLLHDWGYTTITTSMLVQAIVQGASLPPHPIILTFDDANEDNYTNAFPIMKKYGFTGVLYLPYDYLGTDGYLTVDQVKEMAAAGWEVGSHTLTHPGDFLFLDDARLRAEIVVSRKKLEALLGVPILTFAYPFGYASSAATDYVKFAGYIAGMGATGFSPDQGPGNLFVMQRCEIKGSDDARLMTRFLPWIGNPAFLPTDTPTPTATASRTPRPTWTP